MLGDVPYSLIDSRAFKVAAVAVIVAMLSTFLPLAAMAQSKTLGSAAQSNVRIQRRVTPPKVEPGSREITKHAIVQNSCSGREGKITKQTGSIKRTHRGNSRKAGGKGREDSSLAVIHGAVTSGALPRASSFSPSSYSFLAKISSGLKSFVGMLGRALDSLIGSTPAYAAATPPTVTSITPAEARSGTVSVSITNLKGTHFAAGTSVKLTTSGKPDINATNVRVVSSTRITCRLDLTGATVGARDVVVTNTDGGSATLQAGFIVLAPLPTLSSITPNNAVTGNNSVSITDLAGTNFVQGASVKLTKSGKSDINATDVNVASSTKVTGTLNLTGAATGKWNVILTNPDGGSATLKNAFTVNPLPTITSITPSRAPTGSVVSITRLAGTHFVSGASVKLTRAGQGDIVASNVVVASAGKITCRLDLASAALGTWSIVVTNPDSGTATLTDGFTVLSAPAITSVSPNNAGKGNASASVILSGANFDPYVTVKLTKGTQSINASGISVSSTNKVTCTFDLSGAATGAWSFVLTNPDGGSATVRNGFTVNPAPTVTSITPASAKSGNTNVAITKLSGTRFASEATVKLTMAGQDDIAATAVSVASASKITCSLNLTGAAPGTWNVVVTNPDGGNATLAGGFTVQPGPTVTSIDPASVSRGTPSVAAHITGTNFAAGATVRLTMAGQTDIAATGVSVTSATNINCTFGLATASVGAWNVVVRNTDGGSGTLGGGFTIQQPPAPSVTSIAPVSAAVGTTVSVQIAGANFEQGATAKLSRTGQADINATSLTVPTSNEIDCTLDLRGASPGAWSVTVTNPDGQTGTLTAGFTVNASPSVTSITPSSGGTGNAELSIIDLAGTNFAPGASVKLSKDGQTDIEVSNVSVSPTNITCTFDLSNAALGPWDVVVTNPDGGTGKLPGGFTVNSSPSVMSVSPDVGATGITGAAIQITGRDFATGAAIKLTKDGEPDINGTETNVTSPTSASCTLDLTNAAIGTWDVVVTNTDGGSGILAYGFTITPSPTIASISPSQASSGGIVQIDDVSGKDFQQGAAVKLTMSGQVDINASNVNISSSSDLSCTLDLANAAPGSWDVVVTNPDGGQGTLTGGFTVSGGINITSITPSSAQSGMGYLHTIISVTGFQPGGLVALLLFNEGNEQSWVLGSNVNIISRGEVTCDFDLSTALAGTWSIGMANPGGEIGMLWNCFTVTPAGPPTLFSISPDSAAQGTGVTSIELTGRNFVSGSSVRLTMSGQPDIQATDVTVSSSTQITCAFDLSDAMTGLWTIVVTSPDGSSTDMPHGFSVYPVPAVNSISPNSAASGRASVQTEISGENFEQGASVKLMMEGASDVYANSVTINSSYDLSASFDLTGQPEGAWDVVVTNPDRGVASLHQEFTTFSNHLGNTVLAQDTTWSPEDGPWVIDGWVVVPSGITLTILPETVIRFASGGIYVEGTLYAHAPSDRKIVMTSAKDPDYEGAGTPNGGDWSCLYLARPSESFLNSIDFRYAGKTTDEDIVGNRHVSSDAEVYSDEIGMSVAWCTFESSASCGVESSAAAGGSTIASNVVSGCAKAGINCNDSSQHICNNTVSSCGIGIQVFINGGSDISGNQISGAAASASTPTGGSIGIFVGGDDASSSSIFSIYNNDVTMTPYEGPSTANATGVYIDVGADGGMTSDFSHNNVDVTAGAKAVGVQMTVHYGYHGVNFDSNDIHVQSSGEAEGITMGNGVECSMEDNEVVAHGSTGAKGMVLNGFFSGTVTRTSIEATSSGDAYGIHETWSSISFDDGCTVKATSTQAGNSAYGIWQSGQAQQTGTSSVSLSNSTLDVTGDNAYGVNKSGDGPSSSIKNSTVNINGSSTAYGGLSNCANSDGRLSLEGSTMNVTSGGNAYGLSSTSNCTDSFSLSNSTINVAAGERGAEPTKFCTFPLSRMRAPQDYTARCSLSCFRS